MVNNEVQEEKTHNHFIFGVKIWTLTQPSANANTAQLYRLSMLDSISENIPKVYLELDIGQEFWQTYFTH